MGENFALTMRETANQVNENKEQVKRTRHEKYVEDILAPAIERCAKAGYYNANLAIDAQYDWTMVKSLLEELGFTVGHISKYRTLYVSW